MEVNRTILDMKILNTFIIFYVEGIAMAWPNRMLDGSARSWTLNHLYHERACYLADPVKESEMFLPNQTWLMGQILPPFQRDLVWDINRMVRFIESAVYGLHLGTWVYNNAADAPMSVINGKQFYHPTDKWLIDGQQRLTALDKFFNDDFQVFGSTWSQVDRPRQRMFLANTHFAAFETRIYDEAILRELYDRLNFGGVAHTEDQRASLTSVLPRTS